MPPSLEERRPPITPQLAVRVVMLGGFAFALFAIVFFRLWFLQVLSGEDYVSQARENRVRKIKIEAPRGEIVDRQGTRLVRTREAAVVQILPNQLPEAERDAAAAYGTQVSAAERRRLAAVDRLREFDRRRARDKGSSSRDERRERRVLLRASRRADDVRVPPLPAGQAELRALYRRLGRVLGLSVATIHRRVIEQVAQTPYGAVTIKTDVERSEFNYLKERGERFPGVRVEKRYVRFYPYKELAAQLFGTLREISPAELKSGQYRGVSAGERVGKDGVEETYDRYLRGEDGYYRQNVNALGQADDKRPVARREPTQGQRLRLTLDLGLQRAADGALRRAVEAAAGAGSKAGAYVAMDPFSGNIFALGSYPSFDANLFAKPLSQKRYEALNAEENGAPLFNRATAAAYPTGSVFKPVTAMAALATGIVTPDTIINDNGKLVLGPNTYENAGKAVYGDLTLPDALKVSSDVFFYKLGNRLYPEPRQPLQAWARKLGVGRRTGIDLPGETKGLVPDREWRDSGYQRYQRCIKRNSLGFQSQAALFACGGIDRSYSAGDNVNLAVGQGDLQSTPLQMAMAYSTIINGGKVVRPHLGLRVEDGGGKLLQEIESPARRRVEIDEGYREAILEGLKRAAQDPGGTSSDVFKGFPYTVYGKTGTAERGAGNADQSWYVAYVNANKRPILVAVTVEKGGFGAETAAPAARLILSDWFDLGEDKFRAGTSKTR